MHLKTVVGEISYAAETLEVSGWCWSPDRPDDRQAVEIFADGQFIAAIVSARMDLRLLNCDIGDGRHAFTLRLPARTEAYGEIVARERNTGQEFGRVLCASPRAIDPFSVRLDLIARSAAALTAAFPAPATYGASPRPDRHRQVPRIGGTVGGRPGRAGGPQPIAAALQMLRDDLPRAGLPSVASPPVSIIVPAVDARATARLIGALMPGISQSGAEVVVVDGGQDPLASLLPACLTNLRYLFDRDAQTASRAGNVGAEAARGDTLVFLDTGNRHASDTALHELITATMATNRQQSPRLFLHAGLAEWLSRISDLPVTPETLDRRALAYLGLRLCIPRVLFQQLGGFDDGAGDVPGLESVDLALKAGMMGIACEVWREPPAGTPSRWSATEPLDGDKRQQVEALIAFRSRWGRSAAA